MRVIGITGGVGSGKSRVLELLEQEYGALVIQADLVAKELMKPEQKAFEQLVEVLGNDILGEDGTINRLFLADLMFHNKEVIETVNGIVHPMVWQEIQNRISSANCNLVVVEAALTDENHSDIYDELWYVYTSEENRIQRLLEGRGYTPEKTRSVMGNQPSDETFRFLADQVIDNNGSLEETRRQLCGLLQNEGRS